MEQMPLQQPDPVVFSYTPSSPALFRQNVRKQGNDFVDTDQNFNDMFRQNQLRIEQTRKRIEYDGKRVAIVSFFVFIIVIFFFRKLVRLVFRFIRRMRNFRYDHSGYYERLETASVHDGGHIPLLPVTAHNVIHADSINAFHPNTENVYDQQVVDFKITVNGQLHVMEAPKPDVLLSSFLREKLGLRGTKLGCEEGGCGACTVVLQTSQDSTPLAINACLRLLISCDGAYITTVEGIGSISQGLSTEQQRMVECSATQCGYCTPGWVTAMHALSNSGRHLSNKDIQESLDGNICRCTGYRPILKAFEAFAKDSNGNCTGDCGSCNGCDHRHQVDDIENCVPKGNIVRDRPVRFKKNGKSYHRPFNMAQLLDVLKKDIRSASTYRLLGGNTSMGVTKYYNQTAPYNVGDNADVYIDISKIPELNIVSFDASNHTMTVGASISISSLINSLIHYSTSHNSEGNDDDVAVHHDAFLAAADHLKRVANTQVRNTGTWAGNLMINMKYRNFPSDVIIAFTAPGTCLCILNGVSGVSRNITMQDFLSLDYDEFIRDRCIITHVLFTNITGPNFFVEMFKVAQRGKNAHAYVNASVSVHMNDQQLCTDAQVVIGGVASTTFFALNVMNVLNNAQFTQDTLNLAFVALDEDILRADLKGNLNTFLPPYDDPQMSEYKRSVARYVLYKAMIRTFSNSQLPENVKSVVSPWTKKVSKGTEVFYPDKNAKPVSMPIRKVEARSQVTGEAVFPSDEDVGTYGYHGSMVYSTQCNAQLQSINASKAIDSEGVVAFYSAQDIVGTNTGGSDLYLFVPLGEIVECVGQALGVVIAKTQEQADHAASLVEVSYGPQVSPPITTIEEAIKQKSFFNVPENVPMLTLVEKGDVDEALNGSFKVFSGHIDAGSQSHFYMEAQTAIARPLDGQHIEVISGTQAPSGTQSSVAEVLNIPCSSVTIKCPRVGGGFGGKLSRGVSVAAAASLAASKLAAPCKIFNNRNSDLAQTGGREGFSFDYQVGIDENGKIMGIIFDVYVDCGYSKADAMGGLAMGMTWVDNAYYFPNYRAVAKLCKTNTQSRTSMRAPGVVQTCFATEMVISRIATELQKPVKDVQRLNFIQNGQTNVLGQEIKDSTLDQVWDTLLQRSQYNKRLENINAFNQSNLYRKKGISICPVKYGMEWAGYNAGVRMLVNKHDGTIMVSHTGCEIGQGINTKCSQAVLYALGLSDMSMIRVTPTSTAAVANGGVTGGSGTSEVVCQAALNACNNFKSRVAQFCDGGVYNITSTDQWMNMLKNVTTDVSLNVEGWFSPTSNPDGEYWQYFVYAAAVTEIELDVLSGDIHVESAEIVYDCGVSMNPSIDIGQIEGAFVMGLGYFLTESVKHESDGTLFTNGTWEYKPPMIADIPSVFNVTLLKDAPNNAGILRSKATGEPPYVITNSVYFATKMAIASARMDVYGSGNAFDLPVPATVELRQLACVPNAPHRFVMPSTPTRTSFMTGVYC